MSQEKRIELIKQLLEERQELSTKDIMEEFGVSQDTARRDIVLLTKRGEVKRTHGGILPLDFGKSVPNFQSRLSQFTKQKTQIANEAAKYFKPHNVYFVDASTILLKTCQTINMPLTVITHSLDNCIALSEHNKVTVKVLSGTLNHENRYFYSNLAWKSWPMSCLIRPSLQHPGLMRPAHICSIRAMLRLSERQSSVPER